MPSPATLNIPGICFHVNWILILGCILRLYHDILGMAPLQYIVSVALNNYYQMQFSAKQRNFAKLSFAIDVGCQLSFKQ